MKAKKIMKIATICLLLGNAALSNAQVTIGSGSFPQATLDVVASNPASSTTVEGIIAPRLTGDEIQRKNSVYGTAQTGTIIYATSAVTVPDGGKTNNITTAGYYYFDGTRWLPMRTIVAAENGLTSDGQSVKLGGSLNQATSINLANHNLTFSSTTGNIGIGTSAPAANLHIEGTGRITNTPASTSPSHQYLVVDNAGNILSRSSVVTRIGPELSFNGASNWSNAAIADIFDFYFIDQRHTITLPLHPVGNAFRGKLIRFYIYGGTNTNVVFHGVYNNPNKTTFPPGFSYSSGEQMVSLTITGDINRFAFIDIISDGSRWFVNNR